MKLTILGCGGAGGVPLIGGEWGMCDPAQPRNRRLRVSALVQDGQGQSLLVDTSPDMREQLLRVGIHDLSAILYTHAHADHCHGIDNIRSLNWLTKKAMPIYADAETLAELQLRFAYIFESRIAAEKFYRPAVETHVLPLDGSTVTFGGITVTAFAQEHGKVTSVGYRFNDVGYSTDAGALSDAAFETLRGVKVWIIGAIRERPHHTHAHVDMALEWIERVKPERAILTHMDQSLDYDTLRARLPAHVEPAYDGMVVEV